MQLWHEWSGSFFVSEPLSRWPGSPHHPLQPLEVLEEARACLLPRGWIAGGGEGCAPGKPLTHTSTAGLTRQLVALALSGPRAALPLLAEMGSKQLLPGDLWVLPAGSSRGSRYPMSLPLTSIPRTHSVQVWRALSKRTQPACPTSASTDPPTSPPSSTMWPALQHRPPSRRLHP